MISPRRKVMHCWKLGRRSLKVLSPKWYHGSSIWRPHQACVLTNWKWYGFSGLWDTDPVKDKSSAASGEAAQLKSYHGIFFWIY
jgi:hypothetical protein